MPQTDSLPWYHETLGPSWWNEWTLAHVLWGMVSANYVGLFPALLIHTVYEMVEGQVFPDPHRDVSMENHLGDTLAFATGYCMTRGEK